jgi:hypothetical protein
MDRLLNHKKKGVGRIYDRHVYDEQNKYIWEGVSAYLLALASGMPVASNVVPMAAPSNVVPMAAPTTCRH